MKAQIIVFERDNIQVIQEGDKLFSRVFEDGEVLESGDFNTIENAKLSLGIKPTTAENNKLIAEFMGYSQPHPDYPTSTYWYKEGKAPLTILSFHSDWNWLMEVVENIEDLGYRVGINGISCTVSELLNDEPIISLVLGDRKQKISLVHSAVVDFINWYNLQS